VPDEKEMPILLTIKDLEATFPFKKSWVYDSIAKGNFPEPIKLSYNKSVWHRKDILNWLERKRKNRG
jgi:predicted DNA-binding transcriptional regulator AlpA